MKKIFPAPPRLFKYLFMMVIPVMSLVTVKANRIFDDKLSVTSRWDMTIYADGKQYPSWFEVQSSGNILVGRYVGIVGNARPVSRVNFSNGKISFTVPPQWEAGKNDLSFEGELKSDSLTGTLTSSDGKKLTWSAVRAPSLRRTSEPAWQEPIQLFNGKDLTGWHASGEKNQWIVKDGVLQSPHSGSNLLTDATFSDFKLHIEFRYPEGSNSGVYLRGRYEVQIEASHGDEPYEGVFSAVYGFIAPSEIASKNPGEWQVYDITLIGRMVTVVANGKTVICNREIPGITGGAINSKEGEPGPIYIQGDHGPIEYRNIIITPSK